MKLHHSRFHWINKLTPVQILITYYILTVIIATILLSLPISHKDGVHIPLIDVLFVAVSAVSVTGLSTISIVDSLSVTGIFILTGILQLGAVGIMAIGTLIWLLIGKKLD